MTFVKKCYLTLIELLAVMALITLIAGVVAISVAKTLREQRFNNEVAVVMEKMRLAQELMLILRTDAYVKFQQAPDNSMIEVWVEVETPLDTLKSDVQKKAQLKTIQFVDFKDQIPGPTKLGEISVRFLSGGNLMSKGILRLSTSYLSNDQGALERFVLLTGSPGIFKASVKPPEEDSTNYLEDRLTAITAQELQENGVIKPPVEEEPIEQQEPQPKEKEKKDVPKKEKE